MAFWVSVYINSGITVAGSVPTSTEIPLKTGWNLVGYPSFTERNVSDALSGIPYDRIEGYDILSIQRIRLLSGNDNMKPTHGYWIRVSSDATWTIDV
jgi:hypothetical protein